MEIMNDRPSAGAGAHVLLVPLPAQGHMNPMLQFGHRLAYHGLRPTLAATRVDLAPADVPPFVAAPELYPKYLDVSIRQFEGLDDADDVFVNSFHDLEPVEAAHMESTWRAKTVGPTLPSFFLDDGRLPSNKAYGISIFSAAGNAPPCMEWLDKQAPGSVVLASYGTVYSLDSAELEELGNGLCNSGKPFLWVVRSNEEHKLSEQLREKCKEKGLIVSWCPQLEVLKHKATGCFLTHCGWNSTMEAIATGVPMVTVPQSADQPTIARYVETAWEIGVRVKLHEKGLVRKGEVETCIKKVVDGKRGAEYKKNAAKWMQKAKAAAQQGGSSDKNIAEFVAKYL
uniref:Uncharacterized protein n=1 Tax=Oryza brachyantha TaxID=4533 RepID=J3LW01_ORYBR